MNKSIFTNLSGAQKFLLAMHIHEENSFQIQSICFSKNPPNPSPLSTDSFRYLKKPKSHQRYAVMSVCECQIKPHDLIESIFCLCFSLRGGDDKIVRSHKFQFDSTQESKKDKSSS